MVVESFDQADISFSIGTKRNVDRVYIILKDGREAVMTVSLDIDSYQRIEDSPSYQEKTVLEKNNFERAWSVQRYYGGKTVLLENKRKKFLICKEFLHGSMLANYLDDEGDEQLKMDTAVATGKMIANTLTKLNGIVVDSNPLNIIIIENDGKMLARYCDVERIECDPRSIALEVKRLGADFKGQETTLVNSIRQHYQGDLFK